MALSIDQINEFHDKGFLTVRGLLPETVLNPLINDMEKIIDDSAHMLMNEGKLNDVHATAPFGRRIALLTRDAGQALQNQVSFPANLRRPIFDFLHNHYLLDAVESLVGEEIFCNPMNNYP